MVARLTGWRYGALIGGLFGMVGLAMYPIAIDPYLNPNKWKEVQRATRAGVKQEDIQPGGMKVWSDPFDRKQ